MIARSAPRDISSDRLPGSLSLVAAERIFVTLALAFLGSLLIRTAWIADDAAIALRVVQNFVSGYGLRWNVADRVLTFTDPLWVLLLSAVDVVVRQPYIASWLVSIGLTIGAAAAIAVFGAVDAASGLLAIAVLTFSKAFVEYCASGFETPLVVALVAAFWITYWRTRGSAHRLRVLTAVASLCALTDPLATILLLPGLVVAGTFVERRTRIRAVAIGVAPLILWLAFATVYYGSPVPNPIVAAWHAPWHIGGLVRQGGYYLLDAVNDDPVAVAAIGGAAAVAISGFTAGGAPLVIGIVLFIVALVLSGGDALAGRSLVAPLVSAVMLLARCPWQRFREWLVVPFGVVVALGLAATGSPALSDSDFGKNIPAWDRWRGEPAPPSTEANGIRDERRLIYQTTGLMKGRRYIPLPDTSQAEVDVNDALAAGRQAIATDRVGLVGTVAGSRLYVVDRMGRGDAFLAHLRPGGEWRPGGVSREIPPGYMESLESQRNVIADPALAREYNRIEIITRAPLFSVRRMRAILTGR